MATDQSHVYTFGDREVPRRPVDAAPQQAADRRRVDARRGKGYWLLGLDGGIFTFGDAKFYGSTGAMRLNQPINGMERTHERQGLLARRRTTAASSPSGTRKFYGSTGGMHLNQPVLGMERTASRQGLLAVRPRRRHLHASATPSSTARSARMHLSSPVVAMQRTHDRAGLLDADAGRARARASATRGSTAASAAARTTAAPTACSCHPTGKGYWIATADGSVIAFGDAKRLGFPAVIAGRPVALMG